MLAANASKHIKSIKQKNGTKNQNTSWWRARTLQFTDSSG